MKKIYLLISLMGIFAWTSCSNDDDNDNNTPENPTLSQKVTSIQVKESGDPYVDTIFFHYDAKGNIIEGDGLKIKHETDKIIFTDKYKSITYNLANGKMTNSEAIKEKEYANKESYLFSGEHLTKTTIEYFEYENGTMVPSEGEGAVENYKWRQDNITEILWTEENYSDKYTYSYDKGNKNNANIDLFALIFDIDSDAYLGYIANVAGKRNALLPTSCVNTEIEDEVSNKSDTTNITYDYTTNTSGYITQIKINYPKYSITYTIFYKD